MGSARFVFLRRSSPRAPPPKHTPLTEPPQERPEDIPTGELPRTLLLVADRLLANTVTPGTRVTVVGIYSTFKARGGGLVGGFWRV